MTRPSGGHSRPNRSYEAECRVKSIQPRLPWQTPRRSKVLGKNGVRPSMKPCRLHDIANTKFSPFMADGEAFGAIENRWPVMGRYRRSAPVSPGHYGADFGVGRDPAEAGGSALSARPARCAMLASRCPTRGRNNSCCVLPCRRTRTSAPEEHFEQRRRFADAVVPHP